MNISLTLQWAIKHLRTSDSPNLDSEVLLSFVLKKPKEFLFAHPEKTIDKIHGIKYKKIIQRRAKGEPIAYLTGYKEFYGLEFKVNKNVLIPRPETELVVETLKHLNTKTLEQLSNSTFIDVGTGSGCLIISLIKNLQTDKLKNLKTKFYATDISPAALKIARKNARHHGLKIKFLQGNLLEPFIKTLKQNNNLTIKPFNHLVFVANLPYLTTRQWRQTPPDVRLFEPRLALDGGPDGLKYFRQLFRQIKKLNILRPRRIRLGRKYLIFNILLEIDPSQSTKIRALAKKYFPSASLQIKKDLAGRDRVVRIKS